jgi:hypothetical protein
MRWPDVARAKPTPKAGTGKAAPKPAPAAAAPAKAPAVAPAQADPPAGSPVDQAQLDTAASQAGASDGAGQVEQAGAGEQVDQVDQVERSAATQDAPAAPLATAPPVPPAPKSTGAGTRTYVVVSPLRRDRRAYGIGAPIVLTADQAAPLLGHTVKPPDIKNAAEEEAAGS